MNEPLSSVLVDWQKVERKDQVMSCIRVLKNIVCRFCSFMKDYLHCGLVCHSSCSSVLVKQQIPVKAGYLL